MSKIDDFKRAKARADRFKETLNAVSQSACDKFGAKVRLEDTFIGYYGNSSCHSWGDELIKAVSVEISKQLKGLIRAAVVTAEAEAERARKEAESEAREVLSETVGAR